MKAIELFVVAGVDDDAQLAWIDPRNQATQKLAAPIPPQAS